MTVKSGHHLLRRLTFATSVGVVACVGSVDTAAAGPTPAVATPAAHGPQLRIAVDDGRRSAAVGDSLAYTISVDNLGVQPVKGLMVTQTIPAGVQFHSARPDVSARRGSLTWHVDLGVAGKATMHSVMSLRPTPRQLLRLATVVCATLSPAGAPIVCASHSDELAAGAAETSAAGAAVAAQQRAGAHTSTAFAQRWWYAGGGFLVVAVAISLFVVRDRRRRVRIQGEVRE